MSHVMGVTSAMSRYTSHVVTSPSLTQITIYQQFGKPFLKVFAVSLITLKGLQYSLTYLENEEKELAK